MGEAVVSGEGVAYVALGEAVVSGEGVGSGEGWLLTRGAML